MICREDNRNHESCSISFIALSCSPDANESYSISFIPLSCSPDANELCPIPQEEIGQVQCNSFTVSSPQRGPAMLSGPHNRSIRSTSMPIGSINNDTFKLRAGSSAEWSVTHMVPRGSNPSHQLSRVAGCLPSIWEDLAEQHSLTENGQCYGSELYTPCKLGGGYSVQSPVPTSNNDLDLVYREEYHSPSRTYSQPTELTGQ